MKQIPLLLMLCLLVGCDNYYRDPEPLVKDDKEKALLVSGRDGTEVTVQVVIVDGFKFAVATCNGKVSICEVTGYNVGNKYNAPSR